MSLTLRTNRKCPSGWSIMGKGKFQRVELIVQKVIEKKRIKEVRIIIYIMAKFY